MNVVVGAFEPLLGRGVLDALRGDGGIHVVGSDLSGASLVGKVIEKEPAVVIVGEEVEYALLMHLVSAECAPGIVVVVGRPARLVWTWLLTFGASCVAHDAPVAQLFQAVRQAGRGKPLFFGADGSRVACQGAVRAGALTEREIDVLAYLSLGKSNAQIALALEISVETVKTYVARLFRKLDAQSRQELVGVALPPRTGGCTAES
ncbi:MAG TPA: response regulator transcription factor [Solirubrobacteraceae bacterium]|nr:response regulator transcription factor [Solirubrobacteraceae bacterium]